jgi:heptaprenyl diphosphate synthase
MTSPSMMVAEFDLGDAAFAATVREDLARITTLLSIELSIGDETLSAAARHVFHTSGRPLRSLFTVLCAHVGPDPHCWRVSTAGAVVEMLHLTSLHHRDVLDEHHLRTRARHTDNRWHNDVAILAGDYLLATASRLTACLGPDAVRIIADTYAQLATGQMRHIREATDDDDVDPIEHYLTVASERTGSLLATAGRFGATFSSADDDQTERLSRLGSILGIMLQISQDISPIHPDAPPPGTDPPHSRRVLPTTDPIGQTEPTAPPRVARQVPGSVTETHDILQHYATRARHELAALPEGPGRGALITFFDHTLEHADPTPPSRHQPRHQRTTQR